MTPAERQTRATCAVVLLCGLSLLTLFLYATTSGCCGGSHAVGVKGYGVEVDYVYTPESKLERARELYESEGDE